MTRPLTPAQYHAATARMRALLDKLDALTEAAPDSPQAKKQITTTVRAISAQARTLSQRHNAQIGTSGAWRND